MKHQENKNASTCGQSSPRCQNCGLYFIPIIVTSLFLMDFMDWLSQGDKLKTIAYDDPNDNFPQSPIITGLTFFRVMFTTFLASAATFTFISKLDRVTGALQELDEVNLKKSRKSQHGSRRNPDINATTRTHGKRVKIAWFAILYLAAESLVGLICYIIKQWMNRTNFWEPIVFLFMPAVPKGIVELLRGTAVFLSQISIQPIYLYYVHTCSVFTSSAQRYNKQLQAALAKVTETAMHTKPPTHSMSLPSETGVLANARTTQSSDFEQTLRQLRIKQEALITSSNNMSEAWSSTLACLIFGSLAILASLTSYCFTVTAQKTTDIISMLLFVGQFSQPLIGLMIIVLFAVVLEETSLRSKPLWKELITCRQRTRDKVEAADEDGCLLTILHTIDHHCYSLKLSRIINIDRGFGLGMVMGFLGFVCFLIERSENYRAPTEKLEALINTSRIINTFNATVLTGTSDNNITGTLRYS
ncbi:uncharacterized protein LOC129587674 [Paramacrobiotus metropolitanus]|uniref:uncharacterized protein LOC129587674 n=1 Tax=Paramacrobiotus metropolitanus TaxID=2943436 RepID=UPI0024461098|nr:uncharacterized protein LOC129587674 [Paramacrobiotus metropolitanus]